MFCLFSYAGISADETKSRSSSFKSRFRTFFKKNSDLKTEKTYNTNKKTEFESKPLQIQKVRFKNFCLLCDIFA